MIIAGAAFSWAMKDAPLGEEGGAAGGFARGLKAVMYKSPNCGCCVGYAKALREWGFEVEMVVTENMAAVKEKYGIPVDKQSCHTIEVAGYFIEGHVPQAAVQKLVQDRPEIEGIGLPRMPSGTPGMSGPQRAPYQVYQRNDGAFADFMIL